MFIDFFASASTLKMGSGTTLSWRTTTASMIFDFFCCCCWGFVFVVGFVCLFLFFMLAISIDAFRKVKDRTVKMSKCGGLKLAGN